MTGAKLGDVVKVHYTGKLDDGVIFDSSEGRDPVEFRLGGMQVIPGFEQAIEGMLVGEKKLVTIVCEDAYGPYLAELVSDIDRAQFPADMELEVGQKLEIDPPSGGPLILSIVKIEDTMVTLDANHPLAGKDLIFEIELVDITHPHP